MRYQLFPLIVILFPVGVAKAEEPNVEWKAGAAVVEITPEKPMWMAGYAARTKPAEGTANPLNAKVLVIEDTSGARLVIVTNDLIGVDRSMRDRLTAKVAAKHQIPPSAVLINASHTHCGPELRLAASPIDELQEERSRVALEYQETLLEKWIDAVDQAIDRLAPVKLGYTHGRCGVSMNRRFPAGNLQFTNAPFPDGIVDQSVPVLKVSSMDNKLVAILFGYACHNTTLSFYEWCGDYAGFAQAALEEDHPGATALFMMGCGGDQNPYPRGTLELAKQHGRSLANAVNAALSTQAIRELHGPLRIGYEDITLKYAPPPSREELTSRLGARDPFEAEHARLLLGQLEREGKLSEGCPYPVQAIRLGNDFALVALGGEAVVDYSRRLKQEIKLPVVWVAGYSNATPAYIPSLRVLREGGYEAGGAMKYFRSILHPGPFDESIEEAIVGKAHELVGTLAP